MPMPSPPISPEQAGSYVIEFIVSLFFVVLSALGIVFRMYIGRVTQRLDQVAKRLEALEHERIKKWDEHTEQTTIRQIELEKRLSRCELISETLFRTIGTGSQLVGRKLEALDKE
jgi:hypothetical protein